MSGGNTAGGEGSQGGQAEGLGGGQHAARGSGRTEADEGGGEGGGDGGDSGGSGGGPGGSGGGAESVRPVWLAMASGKLFFREKVGYYMYGSRVKEEVLKLSSV